MSRKFRQTPRIWLAHFEFLFSNEHMVTERNGIDRARNLLPRALQALPDRDHVSVISKFAQVPIFLYILVASL